MKKTAILCLALCALLVSTLILTGCGDKKTTDTSSVAASSEAASSAEASSAEESSTVVSE